MSAAAALRLPKVTRAEADAARNRFGHRDALPLGLAGLQLRLRPTGTNCGPEPVGVSLRFGDATLTLRCPAGLVRHALRELDPALDPLEKLPGDLAALLLAAWATPALEAWTHRSGRAIAVLDVSPCAEAEPHTGLGLLVSDDRRNWHVHLACPAELEAVLLEPWPLAGRSCADLRLPATLRIGATRLPLGVVSSLRAGDAVLIEAHVPPGAGFDARLTVADAWTAAARRQAGESGGWMILEPLLPAIEHGRGGWMMERETRPGTPAVAGLDDIPVQLTFEVGRLSMTLGELRGIGPGSILELGRAAGELVEIASHGRPLGRGELVEIDGAVAVRIVRLFDHG